MPIHVTTSTNQTITGAKTFTGLISAASGFTFPDGTTQTTAFTGADSAPTTLTYTATATPNFADGANRQISMTGNLTLNGPINGSNGSTWQARLSASGNLRIITLGTNIVTPVGTTFSGTVSSGNTRLLQMIYNGTKWWVVRNQEFTA